MSARLDISTTCSTRVCVAAVDLSDRDTYALAAAAGQAVVRETLDEVSIHRGRVGLYLWIAPADRGETWAREIAASLGLAVTSVCSLCAATLRCPVHAEVSP